MSDILKNPMIMSLLIGGITFATLNHFNTQPTNRLLNDMKKRKQRSKSLFGEPKEVNILISVLVTITLWYYLYSQQKNDTSLIDINHVNNGEIQSLSSSEAQKSYNLLGKGLQLPNGQQLPDIFHKIV